ncbi:MAG: PQQ-binding-like beta-propeller repeat protein [candidate division WOR-3 bacterium]|nr:PQQ-binding-like beta-propeller repeat protein [candidate division WOR-3 bacterium]
MKKLFFLCLGFLLVLGSTSCQKDTRLKWRLKLGPSCTPPAMAEDGTIYVACENGGLYAVNSSGEIKWQDTIYSPHSYGCAKFTCVAIGADSTIFAGTRDGCVYAIFPYKHYKTADPQLPPQAGFPYCSYDTGENEPAYLAFADDGSVIVACDYIIFSLDTSFYDFELKWDYNPPAGNSFETPPVTGTDGTIYLGSTYGKLYAVNPDSTLKWEFTTDAVIYASPVIDADGTIYIGSFNDYFYAVNPDGSLKWKFKASGSIFSPAVIGEDGTIFFGCEDKHVYALSKEGKLKWRYKTGIWDFTSPVVGADGVIYIGPSGRWPFWKPLLKHMPRLQYVYAINPDGSLRWKYKVRSNISDPTLGADGTLYFTCSKHLYALQTASPGLALSPWPKFGADNQNTSRAR